MQNCNSVLTCLTTNLSEILILLGVAGALSATILEFIKPIIRSRYNMRAFKNWQSSLQKITNKVLSENFIRFNLPPDKFWELRANVISILVFTPLNKSSELASLLVRISDSSLEQDIKTFTGERPNDSEKYREYVEAGGRVKRNIDLVESIAKTEFLQKWQLILKLIALVISALVIFPVLCSQEFPFIPSVILALLGGAISPIAHDLSVLIRKLRASSKVLK